MIKLDIIDEIVDCGISSEDTILQLGIGYKNGKLLETLTEYWGIKASELTDITGIDVNDEKIKKLSKKFTNVSFVKNTAQEYLDVADKKYDWHIVTGIFDEYMYDDLQHSFVLKTITRCLELSEHGVIFTLNKNIGDEFSYNPIFIYADLITNYSNVFSKKIEDNYIFCILK